MRWWYAETPKSTASALSSDFETFLTLLTAQLENQDPLNPVESTDYAVQLATFSNVEQQVLTNELLTNLSNEIGLSNLSQLASWVGMEGQAAVPTAFDGTPVSLYPQMPVGTDQATLVVRNAQGTEVSRQALPISDDVVLWGGFDSTGAPLSAGVYSFELEARSGDKVISLSPIETYGLIKEARVENGQTMLVFESGASVPASEINAVRAPDPGT